VTAASVDLIPNPLPTPMKTVVSPRDVVPHSLAALLAIAAFTGQSYAQVLIGGSFLGRNNDQSLAIDELAGVVPQADWNNLGDPFRFGGPGTQTSGTLQFDNGILGSAGTSAVTITVTANDSWNSDGPTTTSNDKLMKGVIKENNNIPNGSLVFNNLQPGFLYSVIAYTPVNNAGASSDWSLTGATPYQTFNIIADNTFDGTFTQGTSTNPGARTADTDYVRWDNVLANGSNQLTLTWNWTGGGDGAGFAGFQLLQFGPAAGPDRFYNFGPGAGTWDTTSTSWRTTNTAGASDTVFAANDTANFGDLGGAGARTVNVVAGGIDTGGIKVTNLAGNDYTIAGGPIRGLVSALVKDGAGSLTLTGANEFGGNATIKHGTVNVTTIGDAANAGNLGKGSAITIGDTTGASDAALNYGGVTASYARSVTIDPTGGTIAVQNAAATLTLGSLSGSGPLTKVGTGNLEFTGTTGGAFTGSINVPQGGLSVARLGSGSGSINLASAGAATFSYSGSHQTDGRSLTIGNGNATIGVTNAGTRYQINGTTTATAGNLNVTGSGILTLAGAVNFAAFPTINTGATLALQGSGNTFPAGPIAVPTGTLEVGPTALSALAHPSYTLNGGTLRLGHEGLLGQYYSGGANQGDLSGTLSSVNGYFAGIGAPAVTARTSTGGQTNLDFNNGNGGDAAPFTSQGFNDLNDLRARFSGKILITSPGDTTFFTQSDDGSALFIDGQRVVNNNFFQGFVGNERSGTINLSAGLHDIVIYFYEGGGGAGLLAQYTPAGGVKQVIPNAVLFAGDDYVDASRNISVTASSALEIGSAQAFLGNLTQTGGTTLALTGSAKFAGTTLTGTGPLGITSHVGSVNLGPIAATAPVINKGGNGALVFSATAPAGTTINANGGLIVMQGSEAGGPTTNPLATAVTNLNGGGLGLSATGGNPTYNYPVNATGSYRIEAGRFGSDVTAPTTVTLQNGGLVVSAGSTLSTRSADTNFTLVLDSTVSGQGSLVAEEGNVNFTGAQVAPAGGFTVNVARVNVSGPITTGALGVTNNLNGVVPFGGNNTAQLNANSTVDASSVTVNGGSFTAVGALTNSGALSITGGTVNLQASATNASANVAAANLNVNGNFSSTGAFAIGAGGNVNIDGTTTAGGIALTGTASLNVANNVNAGGTGTTLGSGSTLIFDVGAGNQRTYTGGAITVNEGTVRAQSGSTDLGSNAVNFSTFTVNAGLLEGLILNTFDLNAGSPGLTTANPGTGKNANTGGFRLFPRLAETNVKNGDLWGDNETWVYSGEFFDADGIFTFGENIDDDTRLFIDGNLVLNSGCCGEARSNNGGPNDGNNYGMGTTGDGWHRFELRIRNGGGGAGSDPTGAGWGTGDANAFARKGFGLNAAGTTSVNAADYVIPTDNGTGSLFRVATGGGTIAVDAGAALRVGSTTNSRLINLTGAAGSPAVFQINDNASPTANTGNVVNLGGTTPSGTLTVGANNTFTVGKISLADGATLTKNGDGTLIVDGDVAEVLTGPAPSTFGTGNISVTDGALLFNATSTGAGGIAVSNDGTLGGTGTIAGPVSVTNGGDIAPGNSTGTLSIGNFTLGTGATFQLELTSVTLHDVLNVTGTIALTDATLVTSLVSYAGTANDVFFIMLNDGADAVTGTFAGLADGSFFTVGTETFQISYDANAATNSFASGGNDVAVLHVPEPSALTALLGGMSILLGFRRKRA
jgi:fibronectin-binding autotransporter adhesin